MSLSRRLILATAAMAALALPAARGASAGNWRDDFSTAVAGRWRVVDGGAADAPWTIEDGVARHAGTGDASLIAAREPVGDMLAEARLQCRSGGRACFGLAVRQQGKACVLVRYYDAVESLEALHYDDQGRFSQGVRSARVEAPRERWMRFKVGLLGEFLKAKVWPESEAEPDWQLSTELQPGDRRTGAIALVAHDDTRADFDWIDVHEGEAARTKADDSFRKLAEERRREFVRNLAMSITQVRHAAPGASPELVRLRLVTHNGQDRQPVSGMLRVEGHTLLLEQQLSREDFDEQAAYECELPATGDLSALHVAYETEWKTLEKTLELRETGPAPAWRNYVQECLDTLIQHGRDEYGPVQSPLFMAVLDADTLRSPQRPFALDALVRLEDRIHRRGERGCNFWYDQALLRALHRMSELTGDVKYAQAADDYAQYFLRHCRKLNVAGQTYLNGMPAWGTHVYWDCYADRPGGDGEGNGPHEILVFRPEWAALHRVAPDEVQRAIDGIWQHHVVDQSTGLHNRHDDRQQGCDFAFSGGSFVHAFAFMYGASQDPQYLKMARTVAGWHWNNRDSRTGLTADCPGLPRRYDGNHCFTTVVGPHASSLLASYAVTGDVYFRDAAYGYIKSYDRYGWDSASDTYWAMLHLDGTPVPEREKGAGYDAYAPYGHVNVWRTCIYSYEFTLSAAQAALEAYETSVRDGQPDAELLHIAERWAGVVRDAMPPRTGRRWKAELEATMPRAARIQGAYAEDYGRAISFFVRLARHADRERNLALAEAIARDAVDKLHHNGLFLGHPAKPYYESTNGVGLLLTALLELDSPDESLAPAL